MYNFGFLSIIFQNIFDFEKFQFDFFIQLFSGLLTITNVIHARTFKCKFPKHFVILVCLSIRKVLRVNYCLIFSYFCTLNHAFSSIVKTWSKSGPLLRFGTCAGQL